MSKEPKIGDLRVWHNSNFGEPAFKQDIADIESAKACLNLLANYDLYLGDRVVANAQGLEEYVGLDGDIETDTGWVEWMDDDGRDILEVMDYD